MDGIADSPSLLMDLPVLNAPFPPFDFPAL